MHALDPEWRQDYVEQAASWTNRYHHPHRIIADHCLIYRQLLEGTDA